jgi:hypothetical protein
MENYNSIEQVLENLDKSIVFKTKSSILPGIIILATGIVLTFLPNIVSLSTNSIIPSFIFISGIIITILGLFKAFFRKNYFVATSNNQKLKSYDLNFEATEKENLIRMCNNGKISNINTLKRATSNGLRLHFMSTEDLSICFSQVIGYVPFDDVAFSEPIRHTLNEAEYLKKMLA